MPKKYTGIEIGNRQLKMTEVSDGKVLSAAVELLPDNYMREGRIVSPEAMSDLLKEAAKKHRIGNRNCALVLPDTAAFTRRLTMPAMTADQLKINLPFEFHDFISDTKDNYVFDYAVLELTKDGDGKAAGLDLMAAAASKDTIEMYRSMLKRAGFVLKVAAPEAFAYSNLLRRYEAASGITEESGPEGVRKRKGYCFIDLGFGATKLSIFSGSRLDVTRAVETGLQEVTAAVAAAKSVDEHLAQEYLTRNFEEVQTLDECKAVYEGVAVEIMRAVNFYGFNYPDSHIDTVFYCGGGSRIPAFVDAVNGHIGLEVKPVAELFAGSKNVPEEAGICPAAVGITLQ